MTNVLFQQLVIAIGAALLLAVTVKLTRSGRLAFGVAALWSSLAVVSLLGVFLVPVVETLSIVLGVIPAALLAGATTVVLGSILLILSVRVSTLERALQDVAEQSACAATDPPLVRAAARADGETVVVVPAFNEQHSIEGVVTGLLDAGLSVLVVDDGSTDATAQRARRAGASVLQMPTNIGVGGALRAGARRAVESGFTQIVQCDGDGQHPAAEVVKLLGSQREVPVDLLIGSRFTSPGARRSETLVRRVAMGLLARTATRAAGLPITDATSGLRVIRQPLLDGVARSLPRHYLGDTFELLVSAGRTGFRIREEAVTMRPRAHGSSTASALAAFGLTLQALLVVALRAHIPLSTPEHPAS
jgi:hypothetical protein